MRNHEHDWSAWWIEYHKRTSILRNGEYREWMETVNVRICQNLTCHIRQEIPASEAK